MNNNEMKVINSEENKTLKSETLGLILKIQHDILKFIMVNMDNEDK